MKVAILNFTGPVKKRLVSWLDEMSVCCDAEEVTDRGAMIGFVKMSRPEMVFLEIDHTPDPVGCIMTLRAIFPSLTLIGLTDRYSDYMRRILIHAGLSDYLETGRMAEKRLDDLMNFLK